MKEIHSWTPRAPSGRIARELFGQTATTPGRPRRTELWAWLTPAAACGLTMLLAVGGMNRGVASLTDKEDDTYFTAEMGNPNSSNTLQLVRLSEMDENVQWNVWPKLSPLAAASSMPGGQDGAATNFSR